MILQRLVRAVAPVHVRRWVPTVFTLQYKISYPLYLCNHCVRHIVSRKSKDWTAPFVIPAQNFGEKVAIVDQNGTFTYSHLLHHSKLLSKTLSETISMEENNSVLNRVAFLCENDVSYVIAQWAIWMSKGIAVPLAKNHPDQELEYRIVNSECSVVVTTPVFSNKIAAITSRLNIPMIELSKEEYTGGFERGSNDFDEYQQLLNIENVKDIPCLIIYTSGTTGRPKGVVLTYGNLLCNINGMIKMWQWSSNDVILHVLPLDHVHGVVNTLLVPLYSGATVVMQPKFDAEQVWDKLLTTVSPGIDVNVFMAVPTVYAKLIEYSKVPENESSLVGTYIKSICQEKIRLMVSGSAALPNQVLKKWENITGHILLERYGMTETGMVLTNPLLGSRIPGTVGKPFPNVKTAIGIPDLSTRNKYYKILLSTTAEKSEGSNKTAEGELLVKGPNVFKEYWKNPEATAESFTADGWFKTGDTAVYENGVYRILGRTSVDIIKSGGYKISALDIERQLLEHPYILECAVLGVQDITWGQKVGVLVVTKTNQTLKIQELKQWCKNKLPPYQIPTVMKTVTEIPKNAMGKINKKDLISMYFKEYRFM